MTPGLPLGAKLKQLVEELAMTKRAILIEIEDGSCQFWRMDWMYIGGEYIRISDPCVKEEYIKGKRTFTLMDTIEYLSDQDQTLYFDYIFFGM